MLPEDYEKKERNKDLVMSKKKGKDYRKVNKYLNQPITIVTLILR